VCCSLLLQFLLQCVVCEVGEHSSYSQQQQHSCRCIHSRCCRVLQSVAECCRKLQRDAGLLQRVAGLLQCVALQHSCRCIHTKCCSVLQVCCSVLQVCCSVLHCSTLVAAFIQVLQCVAVCCRSVAVCCRSVAVCCRSSPAFIPSRYSSQSAIVVSFSYVRVYVRMYVCMNECMCISVSMLQYVARLSLHSY